MIFICAASELPSDGCVKSTESVCDVLSVTVSFPLAFASEREAAHPENSRQIQRVKAIRQNDELCMILPLSQLYLDGCQSITSLLICCHLFCLGAQTCICNSYSNEAVKNHKKQAKRRNHATLPRLAVGGNCARTNAV